MAIILCQSDTVGFSEFLAALLTENAMSGLVHLDKYMSIPTALLYIFLSNDLLFSDFILSPTHGVLLILLLLILNVFKILSINCVYEIKYVLFLFSTLIPNK